MIFRDKSLKIPFSSIHYLTRSAPAWAAASYNGQIMIASLHCSERWPGDLGVLPRVLDAEWLGPLVPHITGHHPRHGVDQSEARCSVSGPIRGHLVRDGLFQCPHGPPASVRLSWCACVMLANIITSTNGFYHVTYLPLSLLCLRYPITSLDWMLNRPRIYPPTFKCNFNWLHRAYFLNVLTILNIIFPVCPSLAWRQLFMDLHLTTSMQTTKWIANI